MTCRVKLIDGLIACGVRVSDMKPELLRAYPRLKREWAPYGSVLRRTGTKGTPDFILSLRDCLGMAIFLEVKAVDSYHGVLGLERLQRIELDALSDSGFIARAVALIKDEKWAVYDPSFIRGYTRIEDARFVERFLSPAMILGDACKGAYLQRTARV